MTFAFAILAIAAGTGIGCIGTARPRLPAVIRQRRKALHRARRQVQVMSGWDVAIELHAIAEATERADRIPADQAPGPTPPEIT